MAEHIVGAKALPIAHEIVLARLAFLKAACAEVATSLCSSASLLRTVEADLHGMQFVLADSLERAGYLADHAIEIASGRERDQTGYCWTFSPALKESFEAIQAVGSVS